MTFRQLEYLDILMQEKSFSRAAKKLFISQSALSQQIISMEKEWQIQILDRSKSPLEFTENGLLFLNAARKILKIRQQLASELLQRREKNLCVKTVPFFATNLVPYLFSKYHNIYPDITLSITSDWASNLFQKDYQEGVDLFLHALDMEPYDAKIPPDNILHHELLFNEEILIALSSSHPLLKTLPITYDLAGKEYISLNDLEDFGFILPSTSRRLLDIAHLILGSYTNQQIVQVNDKGFDELIGKLQYSNHLTLLPETTLHFCSAAKRVRFFHIREKQYFRPIVASYNLNSKLSTPALSFIQITRDLMKNGLVFHDNI